MNHIGAKHSQKVAINIKITLLNNKYVSEYGGNDFVKEPSNAQLLTDQIHVRTVTADLGKQTLTRYNTNSGIPQPLGQIWSVLYAAQEQHAPLDCLESIKLWVL